MGFESIVIETDPGVNLSDLYRVKEAVEEAFDWYLGDDPSKRLDKFIELKDKASNLTPDMVLDGLKGRYGHDSEEASLFCAIPRRDVEDYLKATAASVGEFNEGNTHLFFDWDKLPTKDITFTCSRNLHALVKDCAYRNYKNDVSELSIDKLRLKLIKFGSLSFSFTLAKWVGYFLPSAAYRMVRSMCVELGIDPDSGVEVGDLVGYKREFEKIFGYSDPEKRLWVVSSY